MAEFCKQCAGELDFPADYTDLFTDDGTEPDGGETGYNVLCEGCGNAYIVDNEGTCDNEWCLKAHGAK